MVVYSPDAGSLMVDYPGDDAGYVAVGSASLASVTESDGGTFINPNVPGAVYVNGEQVLTSVVGTVTGPIISDGPICDWASGTNQDLQLCPNGTGTVRVIATAVPAAGRSADGLNRGNEAVQCWTVSDANGEELCISNLNSADNTFAPAIMGYSNNAAGWPSISFSALTAVDSGTNAAVFTQAATATGAGLIGALGTKPLEAFYNYGTKVRQVDADGVHNFYKAIAVNAYSPASLSGNVDDYAGCTPDNSTTGGGLCRIDGGASSRNITGLTGGKDGEMRTLCAVGANPLVLKHQTTSTAVNQFKFSGGTDRTIAVDECRSILYDASTQRWRERL